MLHAAFGVSHLLMAFGTMPSSATESAGEIDLGLGIHVAICRAVGTSDANGQGSGQTPGKSSQSTCPICAAYTVAVAGDDPDIAVEPARWPDERRRFTTETRRVVFEAAHDFLARGPPYSV